MHLHVILKIKHMNITGICRYTGSADNKTSSGKVNEKFVKLFTDKGLFEGLNAGIWLISQPCLKSLGFYHSQ